MTAISLPEEHMYTVNVSGVETNGVRRFCSNILEGQKVIWHLRRSNHFTGSLQAEYQQVKDKAIELDDERCKLQTSDDAIRVRVIHVLKSHHKTRVNINALHSDTSLKMLVKI